MLRCAPRCLPWLILAACTAEPASSLSSTSDGGGGGGSVLDAASASPDAARVDAGSGPPPPTRVDAAVTPPFTSPPDGGCEDALKLTMRDFTEAHPDFEASTGALTGIVEPTLGADSKPVYAHPGSTSVTTGPAEFAEWYRDVPDVNQTFEVEIAFIEEQPGRFVYDNSAFFPLDDMGFGNGPVSALEDFVGGFLGGAGEPEHNFLFTTEAHTRFTYQGGEQFTFRGDDDLWIFINGQLAIDLGGVHSATEQTVDLDAQAQILGITPGESYAMDIFHAERHTDESNFRIETTIDLSCIENVVVDVL